MLEGGVLASANLTITVKVLNIKYLLDGLEAGSSIGLCCEDWLNSGVGGGRNGTLLDVAGESVIQSNKLVSKIISTGSNERENKITITTNKRVIEYIILETSTILITFTAIVLLTSFGFGSERVEEEPSKDWVDGLAKGVSGN